MGLVRLFIKDCDNVTDPAVRERLKAAQTESDMLAMLAGMCPVASNA